MMLPMFSTIWNRKNRFLFNINTNINAIILRIMAFVFINSLIYKLLYFSAFVIYLPKSFGGILTTHDYLPERFRRHTHHSWLPLRKVSEAYSPLMTTSPKGFGDILTTHDYLPERFRKHTHHSWLPLRKVSEIYSPLMTTSPKGFGGILTTRDYLPERFKNYICK